jgi:hypothetical protein
MKLKCLGGNIVAVSSGLWLRIRCEAQRCARDVSLGINKLSKTTFEGSEDCDGWSCQK